MTIQELTSERDIVLARLERRWAWCQQHPDSPAIDEREDETIVDLKRYEDLEDAIAVFAA